MDTDTTLDPYVDENGDQNEAKKSLTSWAKEPTVKDLKVDLEAAQSFADSHNSDIQAWLDNLNVTGKAAQPKSEDRSSITPKLIRKHAEWRYSSLSEPFLSTPDIFNINPVTAEDKQGAYQNGLLLNNQFNTKFGKVKFIDRYIRTLVNQGSAVLRTGWVFEEEERDVEKPIIEMQIIRDPARYQDMVQRGLDPVEPIQTDVETVKEKVTIKNHPTLEVCDYDSIIIDPTCEGDIDKAQFVIFAYESSRAELKRAGKYQNVDKIRENSSSVLSRPDHESEADATGFEFQDRQRKKIMVYEYWGFKDVNDTGLVEPIVASFVDDVMIEMRLNPMPDKKLPFVLVQYLPVIGKIYGEPDGALLEDNQAIIGAVTRGMIDLMAKGANGQVGSMKGALDIPNQRKFKKGLPYEFNQGVKVNEVHYMHKYADIPSSAHEMLNIQNNEAESLTGVKAFGKGISGTSLGATATGARGALDAASKRELGILRRISEGLIDSGRKIIAMNAEFLSEEEVIRVTAEEFVPVRRDDLTGEYDLSLQISTAEADNEKAQELAFMLQTTAQSTDPGEVRIIRAEIARLRKMPALAQRIEEYQPEPDPIAIEKQQLEIQLLKAQIYNENAKGNENNANANLDNAKAGTEEKRGNLYQSQADKTDLEFIEQETGVSQERDLEKINKTSAGKLEEKVLDASIADDGATSAESE